MNRGGFGRPFYMRQTMKIPEQQHTTSAAIIKWYASRPQEHRPHMGASLIGDTCARKVWLTWRWAKTPSFDGRILRLFEYGKQAEARIFAEMRAAGITVWDADPDTGGQWRVSACNGHFGGSLDAVAQLVPESPKTPCVVEVKTHNDKSFNDLVKSGVRAAKPVHYSQMQIYMRLMDLERALYVAENKNTSDLYTEWVHADSEHADALIAKAQQLIDSTEPPQRLSDDPAHWECKWCTFHPQCHDKKVAEVNCRTCCHSTPVADGKWECGQGKREIVTQAGCEQHLMLPPLVPFAKPVDGGEGYVQYELEGGAQFTNGPEGTSVSGLPNYTSEELQHAPAQLVADLTALKAQFPSARVVPPSYDPANPFADMESDLDDAPVKPDSPEKKKARKRNADTLAALKEFKG